MKKDYEHIVTLWPAGREGKKRILVFSPHPDDDVIAMGGTIHRLVEQGHEVHIAYQTSGNIAVSDEDVDLYLQEHQELAAENVLTIKGLVREMRHWLPVCIIISLSSKCISSICLFMRRADREEATRG